MELDVRSLAPREAYHWLLTCVLPRPIGWASTISTQGTPNLAPFSFFGGVTSDPMTVMLSVGRRKGAHKDTARNLLEVPEAVLHVVTRPLAERMVATSAEVGEEVDEFALAGLTAQPARHVRPLRVAEAAIALEAEVVQHLEVGRGPVDLFLLEVLWVHAKDELLVDGLPDAGRLQAVGRLGGQQYCDTSAPFSIARPR